MTYKTNMEKKHNPPRFAWVDYAKCFSILLVISYHAPMRIEGYIGDFIQMLRMPAFFMIAGFLFKEERFPSFIGFLKHRSIQLLVPYTSFFLIFYTLWIFMGRSMIKGDDLTTPLWMPLWEFIYGNPYFVIAPYWFVCCLFSIQIIYFFLISTFSRKYALTLVFICPLLHSLFNTYNLPWNLSNALLYIPFYAFSNQFKSFIIKISTKQIPLILVTLFLSLTGLYYIHDFKSITHNYLVVICGILILPSYILFVKTISLLKIDSIAEYIGKNTIIILALHNYIIGMFKLYAHPLIQCETIYTNIIITLLTVIICYIPIKVINKYIPCMIGRGKYFENKLKNIT